MWGVIGVEDRLPSFLLTSPTLGDVGGAVVVGVVWSTIRFAKRPGRGFPPYEPPEKVTP